MTIRDPLPFRPPPPPSLRADEMLNDCWFGWFQEMIDYAERMALWLASRLEPVRDTSDMATDHGRAVVLAEAGKYREQIDRYRKHIRWMAQTFHNAYHRDQGGVTWRECSLSGCASTRYELVAIGAIGSEHRDLDD